MRPLAGFVVRVNKGVVTVKLTAGNKLSHKTEDKFTYGDEVRVNYNYKTKQVRSIELVSSTPKHTNHCSMCSDSDLILKQDETL